jgi:hypothetical protein
MLILLARVPEQHVAWLDIAVDELALVHRVKRAPDLPEDPQGTSFWHRAVVVQEMA